MNKVELFILLWLENRVLWTVATPKGIWTLSFFQGQVVFEELRRLL